MIPSHWRPYVRPDDGERLGYLVPVDHNRVVPVTLFGFPLAAAGPEDVATSVLAERGLGSLAEPWWLDREDGVVEVRILSVYGDEVRVVETEYGFFGPDSRRHSVPVPDTDGRLSLERP